MTLTAQKPHHDLRPGLTIRHRDLVSTLAARHRLPAVYSYRYFVTSGGLISYGPNPIEEYRKAAGYVDRILKGENSGLLDWQVRRLRAL
jgi:putative tryptophan/tyrosine transport system substrate-binding protein